MYLAFSGFHIFGRSHKEQSLWEDIKHVNFKHYHAHGFSRLEGDRVDNYLIIETPWYGRLLKFVSAFFQLNALNPYQVHLSLHGEALKKLKLAIWASKHGKNDGRSTSPVSWHDMDDSRQHLAWRYTSWANYNPLLLHRAGVSYLWSFNQRQSQYLWIMDHDFKYTGYIDQEALIHIQATF